MTEAPGSRPRLALGLFTLLALATVGAFFLTQHLKTTNPLINGDPRADPAVINPRLAGVCVDAAGKRVSFRGTSLAFYLQARSDVVSVYVVNGDGTPVATMAGSGRFIRAGLNRYATFHWNGHTYGGGVAPDGTYTFRVVLQHEDRTLTVEGATGAPATVTVESAPPQPRVVAVSVLGAAPGLTPLLVPGRQRADIHLAPGQFSSARVLIFASSASATHSLRLVKSFGTDPRRSTAVWDGLIHGRPAPAGTYLVGLAVRDRSCTAGRFPLVNDPAPHSTPGAGLNVARLAATPSLDPTPAGGLATITVSSGGAPYRWVLRRAGDTRVIFHGRRAGSLLLRVRLPDVGLYTLSLSGDGTRTTVPLVASGVGARASAPVLVVLPALSWQGAQAIDDDGDGLVDSLADGAQISLERPLLGGLPADVPEEAALLRFLDARGYSYDLTTDVALAEGVGPSLSGRHGVLLDGAFTWLPAALVPRLRTAVQAGASAFTAGVRILVQSAVLGDGSAGPVAGPAHALALDPFAVRHGTVAPSAGQLITPLTDTSGILRSVVALSVPDYQVLTPPDGKVTAAAGVAPSAPAIIGFPLGRGSVVEAGLPDFGARLAGDVDSAALLSRVWQTVLR